jgi:hypothetical protein
MGLIVSGCVCNMSLMASGYGVMRSNVGGCKSQFHEAAAGRMRGGMDADDWDAGRVDGRVEMREVHVGAGREQAGRKMERENSQLSHTGQVLLELGRQGRESSAGKGGRAGPAREGELGWQGRESWAGKGGRARLAREGDPGVWRAKEGGG